MFKKIQGGQQALLAVSGQLPILSEEQVHDGVEWSVQCLISETLAHFMLHHMPNLNRAVLSSSFAIMLSPQQFANTKECTKPSSIVCRSKSFNILRFRNAHNLQTHCSPQETQHLLHVTSSGHMTVMMPAMSD
jgi:hypothetical protein